MMAGAAEALRVELVVQTPSQRPTVAIAAETILPQSMMPLLQPAWLLAAM